MIEFHTAHGRFVQVSKRLFGCCPRYRPGALITQESCASANYSFATRQFLWLLETLSVGFDASPFARLGASNT